MFYSENHTDYLVNFIYPANSEVKDGKFKLTAIEQSDGFLRAELFYNRNDLEKCLKRKLDLPPEQDVVFVRSKPQFISLNTDINNVTLKFAIPPCVPTAERPKPQTNTYFRNQAKEFPQYGKLIAYPKSPNPGIWNPKKLELYDNNSPRSLYEYSTTTIIGKIEKSLNQLNQVDENSRKIKDKFPSRYQDLLQVKVLKAFKSAEMYGIETGDSILVMIGQNKKLKVGDEGLFYLRSGSFSQNDSDAVWHPNYYLDMLPLKFNRAYLDVLENPNKQVGKKISGYITYSKRIYNSDKNSKEEYKDTLEPIKNEPIILQSLSGDLILGQKLLTATTNANGYYEFEDLPSGEYRIRLGSDKYDPGYGQTSFGTIKSDLGYEKPIVDLNKQDEVGINFNVRFNSIIEGKVLDEK